MPQTAGEALPGALLLGVVKEWQGGLERLAKLRRAYENERGILARRRNAHLPNNRLAHGFAKYIATMSSGYMVGKPVAYTAPEGMESALEAILTEYKHTDIDSVDIELARHAAIYGKAVQIIYADENASARCAAVSPENAFVVYDDTIESRPLFGVHCVERTDISGDASGYALSVYTEDVVIEYIVGKLEDVEKAAPIAAYEHRFGGVPVIEVWNDENEQGDFEQVESLIDAYDIIESDRANDAEQHVNAVLLLTGAMMERDEAGRTPAQQIRQDRILSLPNADASARYLTADLSQADVEVLKNSLKADIHKFSMVPDLTDEQFAGNASGVAMKYKLLGLESLMKIKEPWFVEALRARLRLFANFVYVRGGRALVADEVEIVLSRSLPVNELEVAQMVSTLQGIVPDATLLAQVPFVDDPAAALDALAKQREEQAKNAAAMYGLPDANDTSVIEENSDVDTEK